VLERLTRGDFAREVGAAFRLGGEEVPAISLVLVEAVELPRRAGLPDAPRDPFTLVFRGPADSVLPQGIHLLESAALGRLEIFLVPVGRDASGVLYEAIFN
jgi:hypothetical protein